MLFFPIQHVLKRSQTVVVIWQLTFVLWCILIRKWTKLKNVEKIGRKCVLQIDHCINSSVLCLWMPLLVCSLEAFERILLIWLDVTELFMGEKLPYFFFFFFCCGCDIFQNFQPAAQYHTEQSPIKHKTSAHLQKFSYWLSSLMSFLWYIWFHAMTIKVNVLASVSHHSNLLTRQRTLSLLLSSIFAPEAANNVWRAIC